MKQLHRDDLFGWSVFDTARNVDFNGVLWTGGPDGNVAIDPMPVSDHDAAHISALGGVAHVLLTNADHTRATAAFVQRWGATVAAPRADQHLPEFADLPVDRWLADGDTHAGVVAIGLRGSKTPGELAFLIAGSTLVSGDLVRGQRAGRLNLLPDPKLADKAAAIASVAALAALPGLDAVLVGDGQSIFRDGAARLRDLVEGAS